jgi:hypothetical protein
MSNAGVRVEQGVQVDSSFLSDSSLDSLVVATGSRWDATGFSPYRPDRDTIPGIEFEHVLDIGSALSLVLDDPDGLGQAVVILDESGSYLPVGLAELLVDNGVDVEIVSPHALLGEEVVKSYEAGHAFPRLVAKGVRLSPQLMVESISERSVEIGSVWGGETRSSVVDTVVLAMTRSSNCALVSDATGLVPEVHSVGDALAPRRLAAVIYEGEKLGREL